MSRFWGGASSGSESEDDDESVKEESQDEAGSEEDSDQEEEKKEEKKDIFNRYDSDEDDDQTKRVVRSQRSKRFEVINSGVKAIKNALKINDWTAILNEFEILNKDISKSVQTFEKLGIPRNFIKLFADLEDAMEDVWANKDARKKMNATNQKALSSMKQKLRKQKQELAKDLEIYRANPWDTEEDVAPQQGDGAASDDDGEDEEVQGVDADGFQQATTKKGRKGKKGDDEADPKELKPENVEELLISAIEARGKKNTDRKKQIELLRKLADLSDTSVLRVRVMLALISAQFDQNISMVSSMNTEAWRAAQQDLSKLFQVLDDNTSIVVREDHVDELSDDEEVATARTVTGGDDDLDGEEDTVIQGVTPKPIAASNKKAKKSTNENPNLQYVTGSIVSIVERLDDEFTKALQQIDPHTIEYIDRLRDEKVMYEMIVRTQRYYERIDRVDPLCRAIQRRVEHIYYKSDNINNKFESDLAAKLGLTFSETSSELLHRLSTFLYKNSNERIRTRALLCHVYHHALHDRFYKARDMLLMSHLQETIQHTDIFTQILYNRTMVQIGMCAFRHGLIREAQSALQEIFMSGKIKELLAQGMQNQKFSEKNPEQEKLERQRQVPFHMHINIDLLDCIYYTSAMCLEIPSMANSLHDSKKRVISRPFRKMLDYVDRQTFTGPAESIREHVVQAAKALMTGDWERCRDLIVNIKIWELMPDREHILATLSKRIQEEGLRTYLFTYAQFYESLSLGHLANMFRLAPSAVHSIISKMIMSEELQASLDQVAGIVILHKVEPSRLQYLAIQYSEKVGSFVESNERLFELRSGFGKDERRDGANAKRGGRGGNVQRGGRRDNRENRDNRDNRDNRENRDEADTQREPRQQGEQRQYGYRGTNQNQNQNRDQNEQQPFYQRRDNYQRPRERDGPRQQQQERRGGYNRY